MRHLVVLVGYHDNGIIKSLHLLSSASLAVVNLAAPLATLVGPGEVGNWDEEERVAGVRHTGKRVVPGCLSIREITPRVA